MATPEPIPYYPPQPPLDPHLRTSDELLAAAAAILARPDAEIGGELRAQACEKLWGAVTRRLKVFADARRWYYCEHSIAHQLVNRIAETLNDDALELTGRFDVAERLHHEGFYEDILDPAGIRRRMTTIQALCATLDDAHRTLPLDLAPPDNSRYKNAARRCAKRRARQAEASAQTSSD